MKLLVALLLPLSLPAFADTRTTHIDFGDELVEGEVRNPDIIHVMESKGRHFRRMVKLRDNFHKEMEKSAPDARRGK